VISVVVLQNSMDLVKGELGSSSEACVTSTVVRNVVIGIEAERFIDMQEEEDQETTAIPVIKTEPKITDVSVGITFNIGYIQNSVLVKKIKYRECISSRF
jgi:hypothetical protein